MSRTRVFVALFLTFAHHAYQFEWPFRVGSMRSPYQEADLRRDLLASDCSGAVTGHTCLVGRRITMADVRTVEIITPTVGNPPMASVKSIDDDG